MSVLSRGVRCEVLVRAVALGAVVPAALANGPAVPGAIEGPSAQPARAQVAQAQPAARWVMDRERITIADRIVATLEVRGGLGASVVFPVVGEALGAFAVVDRGEEPARLTKDGTGWVWSRWFVLEPPLTWPDGAGATATLEIAGVDATVIGTDGQRVAVRAPAVSIMLDSVLDEASRAEAPAKGPPEAPTPRDLAAPDPPEGTHAAWMLIAGGVAVVAFGAGVWWARRRPMVDERALAWERSMRDLDEIAGGAAPSGDVGDSGRWDRVAWAIRVAWGVRHGIGASATGDDLRRMTDVPGAASLADALDACDAARAGASAGEDGPARVASKARDALALMGGPTGGGA